MLMLGVGKECPINVEEGASILFKDSMFNVFIKMSDLFEEDIKAFMDNELKLGLCKYDPKTLFFVYGVEGFIYMSDMAFNIGLTYNKIDGLVTDFEEGKGYGFNFVLIEEETNIIKAIRTVGVTKNFSDIINTCCMEQFKAGLDGYEETVHKVFKEYSSERLVQNFLVGGCRFRGRSNA